MHTCSLKQCHSRRSPGLTLHRLPVNEKLKNIWLEIIGVENMNPKVKEWHVCSLHFDESWINRSHRVPRLKKGAVPSSSLLPWSINYSKKITSNDMVSKTTNNTTSCEKTNEARSPSPMLSENTGDSTSGDSLNEEAINVSDCGAFSTFAEAWTPIENPLAPMVIGPLAKTNSSSSTAIGPLTRMDSPAVTTTGSSKNKTNSQENPETIILHREIKNLTVTCQKYKQKMKSLFQKYRLKVRALNGKVRRRDRKITELSDVIKKLKETLFKQKFCTNNERTNILRESELPEGLPMTVGNTQIRTNSSLNSVLTPNRLSSSRSTALNPVSTANRVSLSQSTAGYMALPKITTTPDSPPSASSPVQLPISVSTVNTLKSHEKNNFFTNRKPKDLMLVISPLTINNNKKTSSSNKITDHIKTQASKELKLTISPLTIKNTLKPPENTDLKDTKSKKLEMSPLIDEPKLKLEHTDVIKEPTSKNLTLTIYPLTNKNKLSPNESTDFIEETKSKKLKISPTEKKSKPEENTDVIKEQTPKDVKLSTPDIIYEKTLNTHESTDLMKEISKEITLASQKTENENENAFIYIIETD